MKYFSQTTNGFYSDEINGDEIPDDAVEITDEKWMELLNGQGVGKVIAANETGYPVLLDPPPLTKDELIALAEAKRQQLLDAANVITADWRTELALGIISDEDKAKLTDWMLYIKEIKTTDITASDFKWPTSPA